MEPVIHVRLLGRFTVARDDTFARPIRLSTKKACALFAFLAISPGQSVSRERLSSLLWGNGTDQKARQSLRQALTALRKELDCPGLIESDDDVIKLTPAFLSVDVLHLKSWSASTGITELERVASLVRGEFLEGLDFNEEELDSWLQSQRRQFSSIAMALLETYARQCTLIGREEAAIEAAERLLAHDPWREDWQRLMLRLYASHRSPGEALARGAQFAQALKHELNVSPQPQTLKLIDEIRQSVVEENYQPTPLATVAASPTSANFAGGRDKADDGVADTAGTAELLNASQPPRFWRNLDAASAMLSALVAAGFLIGLPYLRDAKSHLEVGEHSSDAKPTGTTDPWQPPPVPVQRGSEAASQSAKAIIPIVVLPFATYGEAAGPLQTVADMITDDLINDLSRLRAIRVISQRTSQMFRGDPRDVAEIGARLGVRYVIEGSMQMQADKLRVNIALIDPLTRLPVWSDRIERSAAEQMAIHDEIVGRLARELQVDLYRLAGEHPAQEPGVNVLVHKGYASIIAASDRGPPALAEAERYFLQALAQAPGTTSAIRGLGAYHVLMAAQLYTADFDGHLTQASALLRQAIAKDRNDSGAYFFSGLVHEARTELNEAIESYQRSIEIAPSNALAYAQIGHTLTASGRSEEGLQHIQYALRLSPADPHRSHWMRFAGEAELELHHQQAALTYLRQSHDLNPRHPLTLRTLAAISAVSGHMDEARKYLTDLRSIGPQFTRERMLDRPVKLKKGQPELLRGLQAALDSL